MKYSFDSLRFWIVLFLFSVYLLSFSGKFHVMDELAVFTAGNNLARHGRADINQLIWTNHWTPNPPGIWGQDGNLYTKKAPGISLLTAPLIWLGHALPGLNAVHVGLLTNAVVTALTAGLLLVWLTDLGFARLSAALAALGYGLGTIAWVYARMFWESSMLALSILTAVWAIYRATRLAYARQRLFWIFLAGLAIAIGLTLRFETAPAIVLLGLYLIWESVSWPLSQLAERVHQRHHLSPDKTLTIYEPAGTGPLLRLLFRSIPWGRLTIFFSPTLLITLGLLYFNFARYGSLSETGYSQELHFLAPWVGGFGLLFSPGRGLFIYAPLMWLLFFGLRPARHRLSSPYFWLIALLCLFYWLFYGSWFAWGGTWGWGPRFLLPILPLLMLFVAEPIDKLLTTKKHSHRATFHLASGQRTPLSLSPRSLAWVGLALLAALSLIINLLGITVDFNEHFLRLGRNDNFVFNWAAFPPLAHWHILQEGLIDLIWVRPQPEGPTIDWAILTPALILFGLAAGGLGLALKSAAHKNNHHPVNHSPSPSTLNTPRLTLYGLLFILLPVTLTYQVMLGTARVGLENEQAQADAPLLETLARAAQPGDALLVPMPPFADVQEVSTLILAYLTPPLPTAAWIESEPRAIQPTERTQLAQTTLSEANRVWLFQRWLTATSPTNPTAAWFNQNAFPLQEQWFEQSGRLTLYAGADPTVSVSAVPMNVPFQGGLHLLDFSLFDPTLKADSTVLRLRLTWQADAFEQMAAQGLPADQFVVFAQLVEADRNLAQSDRLLLDLQNPTQSPLLPGQTVSQGYGLALPGDLPSGSYPLIIGLYDPLTGQRLPRAGDNPDDFLYLTDVVVER
jgi:hypothetical protein